jgi:predicted O-methyltransferase YrrM
VSRARDTSAPPHADAAIWQEVEFGAYSADLPLWIELAEAASGPVLELGAGAGRVSLALADRGLPVTALERDPELADELVRRAERADTPVEVLVADLASPADLKLPAEPALVIGPLHLIQMLDGSHRPALLGRLRDLVSPGAILAMTLVDESSLLSTGTAASQILPDMREIDGWVYSSEPLWVQVGDDVLTVRRIRERVSPEGRIDRTVHDEVLHRLSPERLELEAEEAELAAADRRIVGAGPNEADSIVVLLEAR